LIAVVLNDCPQKEILIKLVGGFGIEKIDFIDFFLIPGEVVMSI
jgi:hypothetical protein